ncbi:phage portal protein [Metabacillus sp. 84]|uniref:phage portal protein n=1 Tax=Metabacillus sp. 84 TaxID=3404705 RepID=UPI003CF02651
MGLLDIFKKNSELEFLYDFDLIDSASTKIHLKKLAIQTCVNMIGRTISQTEFYVKKDKKVIKDEMYYRLNVRPNINDSANEFWETVIHKLIHDNECLIIQSDTKDLLIADSFIHSEFAMVEDTFKEVKVKNYEFSRTFQMRDVLYFKYNNDHMTKLLDSLYTDYGELFGKIVESQKRKNQIRGIVDIETAGIKNDEQQEKIQNYINKVYKAITEKSVAIVPQQKGFKYDEKSNGASQSVDEVNKVTGGFLDQVAQALGIPIPLIRGDMADIEKLTRNYMTFCIDPLLKKIRDELNAKLIDRADYLNGEKVETKRISYSNMFDIATAVDKLRSSGTLNGNELREALGLERVDDPMMDVYFITKNYQESSEALKGGENE